MNNNRRKEIKNVIDWLKDIQAQIENIRDDEQDYIDNMPENLQESERHESAEAAVENLDSAIESIEELIDNLSESVV